MKSNPIFKFALLRSLTQKRSKASHSQQGFTLVEVLVAVVVLSIFVLAAMSALVIGLNGKLKAKLNNEATLIIEQDLEKVRYSAVQTFVTSVSGTPTFTGTTTPLDLTIPISLVNGTNYLSSATAPDTLRIGFETVGYTLTSAPSSNSGTIAVTADFRKINTRATSLAAPLTISTSPTSITVANTSRITVGDIIVVGPDASVSTSTAIFSATVSGKTQTTVTFTNLSPSSLAGGYASNTPVTILPRSGEVIADIKNCGNISDPSIASTFKASIPDLTISSPAVNFNGRDYRLTRSAFATSTSSGTRVQLVYNVFDTTISTTSSLASLTTEVIPNVALQCP